jgi:hypothetical protein
MAENYFSKAPKFNPAAFTQGANLGMWGKSNLDPSSPAKQFVVPEGVDPNLAFAAQMLNPYTDRKQDWEQRKEELNYWADLQEKQAERRQKFGEESTGKAVLYQSLANLGPMIAQAMNPGYLIEGASRITGAANEAFRSVPSMNVQSPGYNVAQFKYF